jgi:transcription elongation factor SPT5
MSVRCFRPTRINPLNPFVLLPPTTKPQTRRREAELQFQKDQELDPEKLEAYLKEKFGGRRAAAYASGVEEVRAGAVSQQALMPTARDPKLWAVNCVEGREADVVCRVLQKCYDYRDRAQPLLVKAVFAKTGLKGYIYVEAHKETHVREALKGLHSVLHSKPPKLVPLSEMVDAITAVKAASKAVQPGAWVRFRGGIYKGDLARVVDVDLDGGRVTVRVVPRLDYAAIAARRAESARGNGPVGFPKQPKVLPPPRAFNPDEARSFRLDVDQVRNRETGAVEYVLGGSQRFQDGYLVKKLSLKSLAPEDGVPPLNELQRFNGASQGANAGANGDLAGLVDSLQADGDIAALDAAAQASFEKGDRIVIVEGDLKDVRGVVEHVADDGAVVVRPTDEKLAGFDDAISFRPRELAKRFDSGDHVRVVSGQHVGQTGMVVSVEGPICHVFTDATRQEVKIFARDLKEAVEVASSLDTIGGYDLFDLVVLDPQTVGVIVGVEQDSCSVLTNQGRPEKPDVRVCRLHDLKRKADTRRNVAQDGSRNEVGAGDIVEVADGPLRGRSGTVKYIMRGFLFIKSTETTENGGFSVVQPRHCRVRGGARLMAGGGLGVHATPARTPAYGGALASPFPYGAGPGVLASPARGNGTVGPSGRAGQFTGRVSTSQDRLLEGRTVTVKKGPYMGLKGRVLSATATHCRVELDAQMKTVTVDRTHLSEQDGGVAMVAAPRAPMMTWGSGVGATPAHPGGRTPAHPGFAGPTPAHWSSGTATPAHAGFAGPTPAYDPAWAATPAHPGFDGGSTASVGGSGLGGGYKPPMTAPYAIPGFAAPLPPSAAPLPELPGPSRAHWVGVEVTVPGGAGIAVVQSVSGGTATITIGGATQTVLAADLRPVPPTGGGEIVRVLAGDLAGLEGSVISLDGGDVILTVKSEIKVMPVGDVGRVGSG